MFLRWLDRLVGYLVAGAKWLALPLIVIVPAMAAARGVWWVFPRGQRSRANRICAVRRGQRHRRDPRQNPPCGRPLGAALLADAAAIDQSVRRRAYFHGRFFADRGQEHGGSSILGLELFQDSGNPGYFLIKAALWLMVAAILAQAAIDIFRPRKPVTIDAVGGARAAGAGRHRDRRHRTARGGRPDCRGHVRRDPWRITGAIEIAVLGALPSRLINLFENDLLQALPLYVTMGLLLDRLPVADALYRAGNAVLPRGPSAPLVSGMMLGALLGPMNGSVGASVLGLSRVVSPRLAAEGLPAANRHAIIAVASTLGVLVPPSLVLILLSDAMMSAHTMAVTATGRSDRVVNTQDIFHAALLPGGIFSRCAWRCPGSPGAARQNCPRANA